jgi:hypothetical protein
MAIRRLIQRIIDTVVPPDRDPEHLAPRRVRRLAAIKRAKGRFTARRFWTAADRHEAKPPTREVTDLGWPYPGQSRTIRDD